MFEEPAADPKKDRSRLVIVLSTIAVLVVIALIIVVGSRSSRQRASGIEMSRPGSPDFDSYSQFVQITDVVKETSSTLLGRRLGILRANVRNTGDKALTGLRIRAAAVGFGNEV